MKEWSIVPNPVAVKAGEVRFFASNTGKTTHELVVVKSDEDVTKLPTYGTSETPAEGHVLGDVNEDKITSEGEVEDIEGGATKDATFVLAPGKYVLMCNLPTHYGLGMRVAFTVN
ncbi:MAG: plastocyanin/azurin family copper-binding protein [Anaerolineaceae bacterium]